MEYYVPGTMPGIVHSSLLKIFLLHIYAYTHIIEIGTITPLWGVGNGGIVGELGRGLHKSQVHMLNCYGP